MRRTLHAALFYGLAMFAAGFLLGTVRELLVIGMFGWPSERAELVELPVMLLLLALVSRWLVRRKFLQTAEALAAGIGGAALLAALDVFIVGMGLRGLGFSEALGSLDPRTGTLFPFALAFAAVLPFLASLFTRRRNTA